MEFNSNTLRSSEAGEGGVLVLLGIAVVILGFALRINPLAVVVTAAIVTGLCAHFAFFDVVAKLGHAVVASRFIAIAWLVLPVIGLLERGGIRERAKTLIARLAAATPGKVLILYLALRQISSALGLTALGGHVPMVRPLIAPMAEAAAERIAPLDDKTRDLVRANAAAADNVGVFFGEDVFVAVGSILLIKGFLEQKGIIVAPAELAIWAVPTAILAFAVHATRLWLFDRRLARRK